MFYIISTIAALYAAYLVSFKAYERDNRYSEWKKSRYPYIVYIAIFAGCFIPVVNTLEALFVLIAPLVESNIKLDAWLYKTPGEEDEKEDEE